MTQNERLQYLRSEVGLSEQDLDILREPLAEFSFSKANRMAENVISVLAIPLGVAFNFVINGKKYFVPMATEEPSVIAAASKAAKIAGRVGGFVAEAGEPLMLGQLQITSVGDRSSEAKKKIFLNKKKLLQIANSKSRSVNAIDLQVRELDDKSQCNMGTMLILELIVDTKDAMGANIVNTMCESIAPEVEKITSGQVIIKIVSNYATKRLVKCRAVFAKHLLGNKDIVDRIMCAYAFAYSDVYRAVTHNKGIMNGIDAVAIATGQDFRAIEAGAHAYAARDGTYRSMTRWHKTKEGDLEGELEIPMAVGIVGGVTSVNPIAKTGLKILRVQSSKELAMVLAATGLAQNLAALLALASEGIQKGHMRLHARNVAVVAGAKEDQIDLVAKTISDERNVNVNRAKAVVDSLNKKNSPMTTNNDNNNNNIYTGF